MAACLRSGRVKSNINKDEKSQIARDPALFIFAKSREEQLVIFVSLNAVDEINRKFGRGTIKLCLADIAEEWSGKADRCSPRLHDADR